MTEPALRGRRVFVAEDDYLIADEMREFLEESGAEVIGPVPTVSDALALIGATRSIDGAVLDINLRGRMSFEVADALLARGVPFIFVTGYEGAVIPQRYAGVSHFEKPVTVDVIVRAFGLSRTPSDR